MIQNEGCALMMQRCAFGLNCSRLRDAPERGCMTSTTSALCENEYGDLVPNATAPLLVIQIGGPALLNFGILSVDCRRLHAVMVNFLRHFKHKHTNPATIRNFPFLLHGAHPSSCLNVYLLSLKVAPSRFLSKLQGQCKRAHYQKPQ